MAADDAAPQGPRAFWSGTLTFGLVSIPVDLFASVRSRRVSLRMLSPEGHPLIRRYVCPKHDRPLQAHEIVRGYPTGDGEFVVVSDEELQALEPRKSRDIDLQRFVGRDEIDFVLLERAYVLAPAGQSSKAYQLLVETLERTGRAGIASFVMRGKAYLVAIFAQHGLLHGQTLRFVDEVRSPQDVGLPAVQAAPAKRRRAMAALVERLGRDELDRSQLKDEDAARTLELARRKLKKSQDVVRLEEPLPEADEETGNVIDLMKILQERLGTGQGARSATRSARPDGHAEGLAAKSKHELYERAKQLDIPGRSSMSKGELIEAIRAGG